MRVGLQTVAANAVLLWDRITGEHYVAPSTLTGHLNRLEGIGLIGVVERDREGLERGKPYRFFRLTEAAEAVERPSRES